MARKSERVLREMLYRAMEKKETFFTQRSLSKKCRTSIGNVHKLLTRLEKMNCIEKKPKGFHVINKKKALLYWASIRNLEKDIVYKTRVGVPVAEIEKNLPPVIFTAYSAYKFRFNSAPSDYSEVIVYGNREKIKERFGHSKGKPDLIVLKPDPHLSKLGQATLAQIYVDLWNLGTWYAEEFLKALEKKIE